MARTIPGVTRQRLIEEAVRLFSTKGYAATSVADIQVACGLTAGSGALYKHFPSKRALLEEAVHRHLEEVAERSRAALAPHPDGEPAGPADGHEDGRAALLRMARTVWDVIENDRDLIRIMLREFDGFPELFEGMWQGVLASVYRQGAAWVAERRGTGGRDVADPEATAAVLVASLTYYPLLRVLIGRSPGDVEQERFLAAWVDNAAATLGLPV